MRRKNASVRRLVGCALLASVTAFSPLFATTAQASSPTGSVVIGEIAWAGSTLSTADEWVELWNIGEAPASIGNWSLRGMGESGRLIVLSADSIIPAHGTYLISNYPATDAKCSLAVAAQAVTTTVSLSNSNLKIELLDAAGAVVDTAGDGNAPPAGSSLPTKASMIRADVTADGAMGDAWGVAVAAQNLKPGLADLATPGMCDGCLDIPTPVDTAISEGSPTSTDATAAEGTPTAETSGDPAGGSATSTEGSTVWPEPAATSTEQAASSAEVDSMLAETASTASSTSTPLSDATSDASLVAATSTAAAAVNIAVPTVDSTGGSGSPTQSVASAATDATTSAPQPKPAYGMLRLNEISPAPSTGKEWVEIASLDASNPVPLKGCELHDRQGRIATIGTVTVDPSLSPFAVIQLSSARLNNDGDMVALYCDSRPIDAMNFTAAAKGQTWIRLPDRNGVWLTTATPTPGAENLAIRPQNEATATAPAAAATAKTVVQPKTPAPAMTQTVAAAKSAPPPAATDDEEERPSLEQLLQSAEYAAAEDDADASDKTTTKKTAKKTTADPIIPFTFDMLDDFDNSPIRVRLEGAVGSTAGLLPYHSFVLLSPEGRGLQVRVPTGKKLPDKDLMVSVTGNLLMDDRGRPYLKMLAKDEILLGLPAERLTPRLVDLELPANEDAWAYVSVTGTVKSVKARNVMLSLDGLDLTVAIKPTVRYRPQRLVAGDEVRIDGVLDLTGDEPRLLPRTPDDIILLKHAEPKAAAAAPQVGPTVPGWTPFGAAAGAVAVTEGAKHYRKRRQQKMLERKLHELTA